MRVKDKQQEERNKIDLNEIFKTNVNQLHGNKNLASKQNFTYLRCPKKFVRI